MTIWIDDDESGFWFLLQSDVLHFPVPVFAPR